MTSEIIIPEVGEFIKIPAWRTFGCVIEVHEPMPGTSEIEVIIQEHPDQPVDRCKLYRLQPGEFEII